MSNPEAIATGARLIGEAYRAAATLRVLWGKDYNDRMAEPRKDVCTVADSIRKEPGHPAVALAILQGLARLEQMDKAGVYLAAWWWFAAEGGGTVPLATPPPPGSSPHPPAQPAHGVPGAQKYAVHAPKPLQLQPDDAVSGPFLRR